MKGPEGIFDIDGLTQETTISFINTEGGDESNTGDEIKGDGQIQYSRGPV